MFLFALFFSRLHENAKRNTSARTCCLRRRPWIKRDTHSQINNTDSENVKNNVSNVGYVRRKCVFERVRTRLPNGVVEENGTLNNVMDYEISRSDYYDHALCR